MKILLPEPFDSMYHVLSTGIEETRSGRAGGRKRDYSGDLIPMLYVSFLARGLIALATGVWFGLMGLAANILPSVSLETASAIGLALGWTGALGMMSSLARHLGWWLMKKRESFLMRTRIVEPWRWDIVWQAAVAIALVLVITP